MPAVGLRERKKERTRDELTAAAISLFATQGYDRTTVEDIAVAADVSPRTFFRYYPTKEDVVVSLLQAGAVDLQDEFARRGTDEPLAEALRAATRSWAQLGEQRAHNLMQLMRVIAGAPSLRARLDDERRRKLAELTEVIARRIGADPRQDPRPALIARLTGQVVVEAMERWSADGRIHALADYLDAGFDLLTDGLPR